MLPSRLHRHCVYPISPHSLFTLHSILTSSCLAHASPWVSRTSSRATDLSLARSSARWPIELNAQRLQRRFDSNGALESGAPRRRVDNRTRPRLRGRPSAAVALHPTVEAPQLHRDEASPTTSPQAVYRSALLSDRLEFVSILPGDLSMACLAATLRVLQLSPHPCPLPPSSALGQFLPMGPYSTRRGVVHVARPMMR